MPGRGRWVGGAGLAALCFLAAPAPAALAQGGEEPISLADDPFEVTDPFAAKPGSAELALVTGHDRARRGRWRGAQDMETELAVGVRRNVEVRLGQSVGYGRLDVDRRLDVAAQAANAGPRDPDADAKPLWGGTTRLGALVQLNGLGGPLPAASVLQRVRAGYSARRTGYESETSLLLGQTVGRGPRPLGLSLNLGWTQLLNPTPGERAGRWFVAASVGQAVARDTALVLTYVRERQDRGQRDFDLLQAGVRHRLPSGTVLGVAAGVGLGRDSPRFQIGLAAQWSFDRLW